MTRPNVLVVEDELKIASLLRDYLVPEGFEVTLLADGLNVMSALEELNSCLMILDWMLPGEDGLSICCRVRARSAVPIIMLTARVDEQDRLDGFAAGADDYVCKPFLPRELVARVHSILRRSGAENEVHAVESVVEYRGVQLDDARLSCVANGERVELTPVEFRMLRLMLSTPGTVYSRYQLMREIYADHRIVSDRTIDSHVSHLRRKLADAMEGETLVHSAYSVGYKVE